MASFETRGETTRAIVRIPGTTKKLTATFDTPAEAHRWAKEQERKKSSGALTLHSGVTVADMFEEYLDNVASKTDSAKWNHLRIMAFLNDPLSKKRLNQVITHDINEWIARREKEVSGSTVNRELNLMGGAFTYAVKTRKWIGVNPCHGAHRPPENAARDRPLLTPDEIRAVCVAAGYEPAVALATKTARVGACFLLALETGMRVGEILRARPVDYKRDEKVLVVAAIERGGRKGTRSGKVRNPGRRVPLTDHAIALLDQLLAASPPRQPYIVGLTDAQRDALWRKVVDRSGVTDLKFHDTKHEAATRLSKHLDVLALSHAIGTKDLRLLRDTYYNDDAKRSAALLPAQLTPT